MTPDEWARVTEIFHAALDLAPEEQPGFVARKCAGHPLIAAEVHRLLAAERSQPSGFLDPPIGAQPSRPNDRRNPSAQVASVDISALTVAPANDSSQPTTPPPNGSIGPYHLLQLIGSGGMGEVWLAEQTLPVSRRVALKLIKAGMDTREVVARFQSERQALALMDHPGIAKVFEAGSTSQGRPYFVMEYITGVPITEFCDQHKMTVRQRLELFVEVCEGVQHAHQKAIIHRDLKPSNILVSELNGKPLPRIIDFGIAKAMSQGLAAEDQFTRTGVILGTPAYMSPEQAGSGGADVDTRTDVYSLGAVLYELLVGQGPLDLRNLAFDEKLRLVRDAEAPRPSTRLRTLGDKSSATAQDRGCVPPTSATLARLLRGDLDAITLKALEKDRSRRYASPSDLAADIGRHLRNEAVLAVAPSTAYRARKFARRYRGPLLIACAFALVLMVAAVVSIRQSIRANREAATAQAVNSFWENDVLAQASAANQRGPGANPDLHLEVRTALDRSAARLGGKFNQQPEVEAAIRDTIGQTYLDLGLYPQARTHLERALELHRRVLGGESPEALKTAGRLAQTAFLEGKYAEAEVAFNQNLEAERRVLGPEHPDTLASMSGLADVYRARGKYAQAEELYSRTVEIQRRVLGAEHPDTLGSMNGLARVYHGQGTYPQAEVLYSQVVEISRRVLGPEHPDTLTSMYNLAGTYRDEGKISQAESLYDQVIEIRRRVLGPTHPQTLNTMVGLGNIYWAQGKYAQAEALLSQTLQIERQTLGPEHLTTLISMNNLANVYAAEGKYAQAEALHSQALEIKRRVLGPEHYSTLSSMNNLAEAYGLQREWARAEALFNQTLEIKRRVLGPEHPETLVTVSDFASMYLRQGKCALAETYAAQALAGRRHRLPPDSEDTVASAADLALAYVSQGKFVQAEPLAREALAFYRKQQPDDWQRFRAESLLGASLAGQKKYPEAEPLLREGYQGMLARKDRIAVPDQYYVARARQWLLRLHQPSGGAETAAK